VTFVITDGHYYMISYQAYIIVISISCTRFQVIATCW